MKAQLYKKLIYLFAISLVLSGCRTTTPTADTSGLQTAVTEFGEALETWSKNKKDGEFELKPNKYVISKAKVLCRLMHSLNEKYPPSKRLKNPLNAFNIDTYKNNLSKWFDEDSTVLVRLTNVLPMSKSEIEEQTGEKTNSNKSSNRSVRENYALFKGELSIKKQTENNLTYKDSVSYEEVYYVNIAKEKIGKIENSKYTASGKIKIDWSNLEEERTIGGNFNYSPNWSGLSISYSWLYLMGSLDVGYNADDDKVTQEKLDMTNVLNYTKETVTYDPVFYATVTPSVYLKYVSIGCGVGCMFSKKTIIGTKASASYEGNETFNTSKSSLAPFNEKPMFPHTSFMLRPSVKGFIPLNDEWFITASASYDYSFGVRIKNGISFGLGFQYRLY